MSDRNHPYEGLFLFPQAATANLQAAVDHIRGILARADAELISLRKWEERRLAYEIKGNKRGVYFLVYFTAAAEKLREIERACNLSEELLRSMVTRADHVSSDQMAAADGQAELADEIRLRAEQPAAVIDDGDEEEKGDDADLDDIDDIDYSAVDDGPRRVTRGRSR